MLHFRHAQAKLTESDDKLKSSKRDLKYYRKLSQALEQMHGPLSGAHLMNMGLAPAQTPGGLSTPFHGILSPTAATRGPSNYSEPDDGAIVDPRMFMPTQDSIGRTVFVRFSVCMHAGMYSH
jgi:hypothetical protein